MKYEELINTISIISENDMIYKKGLTLTYTLPEKKHKQMNSHLFYKSNLPDAEFIPQDEFEVELGGIIIKFIKESL
jgi:hypothetical protein